MSGRPRASIGRWNWRQIDEQDKAIVQTIRAEDPREKSARRSSDETGCFGFYGFSLLVRRKLEGSVP